MILVPALIIFAGQDEIKSRATAITCILFMVITSSFFYLKQNYIDWNLSIKCAIGGAIGGIIGSKILIKINKKILQILFIIFLIYSSIRMIF